MASLILHKFVQAPFKDIQVGGRRLPLTGGREFHSSRLTSFLKGSPSSQHIVKVWDLLPQDVVKAASLDGFTRGLEKFLEDKTTEDY